jgi:hypothetical protein
MKPHCWGNQRVLLVLLLPLRLEPTHAAAPTHVWLRASCVPVVACCTHLLQALPANTCLIKSN